MPAVSIVIRTKNEERWIGRCLRMVYEQSFKDFEVILVDSNSSDHTLEIARKFPVRCMKIDQYQPGKAINMAASASAGEFIACLSAHCIPRDEGWLTALVRNMESEVVAGVYGRQLPFSYSSDLNKRDLLITFGLDHRVQIKDSFFHNANSLVRRSVWEKIPFNEEVTNIEDRLWGKAVIDAGWRLAYEPEAAVFHHHGIHQDGDEERCQRTVRIMESLDELRGYESMPVGFHPKTMKIVALLPVLGPVIQISNQNLLERCIGQVKAAGHLKQIVVISENPPALEVARKCGVDTIERPPALGLPHVGIEEVLQYALKECERGDEFFDAVIYVNYLYPFRPPGFFDRLTEEFALSGVDTLVPTLKDYQPYWMESGGKVIRSDAALNPRDFKVPMQKGMVGLGCIASSEFVRKGNLLGENIALVPFEETLYSMKASDIFARSVIAFALERGVETFGVKS